MAIRCSYLSIFFVSTLKELGFNLNECAKNVFKLYKMKIVSLSLFICAFKNVYAFRISVSVIFMYMWANP